MIDAIFYIILAFTIIIGSVFMPTPIGNENSTVRRLPYITFAIIALNILIFVATLPLLNKEKEEVTQALSELNVFLSRHPSLLQDDSNIQKLIDAGVVSEAEARQLKRRADSDMPIYGDSKDDARAAVQGLMDRMFSREQTGPEVTAELDEKIANLKTATASHFWYKFGLAPNGQWKIYQPITSAFIHGGWLHLIGNMLFLFAVAFSLEDIWGRPVFLAFYLVAAFAATVPELINPLHVPSIGASGAVSAVMGAFLVRLYKTKIKVFWISLPYALTLLASKNKPYGIVNIPAYIYLPFYFVTQALNWWLNARTGRQTGIAYSVHVAGFLFGAAFALALKASKLEEKVLSPKIESKVSFSGSSEVTTALELIDQGDLASAEKQLQIALTRNPNDVDAIMGLIQVHQRAGAYKKLNDLYSRVIRHHLALGDKEAALYAYDALLSAAPEGEEDVRIPPRDWFTICDYLKSAGMVKEAAVEFERLANTWPDTPFAARACLQGSDAALAVNNYAQALNLLRLGAGLSSAGPLASKLEAALTACEERIAQLPVWEQPKDFKAETVGPLNAGNRI
ncbi:MAG TPA: rhomboid family intramembrane serine protease [Blastocatellia bacterium]|nr:rhomboid family intramembrane serine protease [Blastocatellia bacterium]